MMIKTNVSENKRRDQSKRHDSSVVPFLERLEPTMLRLLWLSAVATVLLTVCQAHSDFDKCDTQMCTTVTNILIERLDYNILPCHDFGKHTCGSQVKFDRRGNVVSGLDQNSRDAMKPFRDILEENFSSNVKIRSLEIEKDIFKSCIKYGLRNKADEEQYYHNLPEKAKILYHLDVQTYGGNEHWISSDRYYAHKGYGYAFFDLKIVETYDNVRSRMRYIQIAPPTDNIMDIRALFDVQFEKSRSGSSSYQTTTKNARDLLKNFFNDLNSITQKHGGRVEDGTFNSSELHSIAEWDRRWSERARGHNTARIDWEKMIRQLFIAAGLEPPKSNVEIIVKEEQYFSDLFELLSKSNVNTIENYVNLRYISKTIGLVDSDRLSYSLIPSINKLTCLPGLFVGTAYAFAKNKFGRDNQNKLKEVFEEVKKNIIDHLGSNNEFTGSDATRAFVQKLANANVMYGYPDWLLDENLVANLYPDRMIVNERYFNNEDIVYSSVLKHNLKTYRNYSLPIIDISQLFKAVTSDRIEIFERNSNEIVIPVRVFSEANFPFFSALLYDPMNYGSAAAILATEIYYKWLDEVADTVNVTDCMKNHLPRSLPQKETERFQRGATAYLLGLRTAYEAWPNKNSYPIWFPNFGAIHDSRLFFLSFAQTLCDSSQNDQINNFNGIGPAGFMNAVLSAMEEFQETFVCDDKKVKCNPLKKEQD